MSASTLRRRMSSYTRPSQTSHSNIFCEAANATSAVSATTTLPAIEQAGRFRVEAKRYGKEGLERVIALARPTA